MRAPRAALYLLVGVLLLGWALPLLGKSDLDDPEAFLGADQKIKRGDTPSQVYDVPIDADSVRPTLVWTQAPLCARRSHIVKISNPREDAVSLVRYQTSTPEFFTEAEVPAVLPSKGTLDIKVTFAARFLGLVDGVLTLVFDTGDQVLLELAGRGVESPHMIRPLFGHKVSVEKPEPLLFSMFNPMPFPIQVHEASAADSTVLLQVPWHDDAIQERVAFGGDPGGSGAASWTIPPGEARDILQVKLASPVPGHYSTVITISTEVEDFLLPVQMQAVGRGVYVSPDELDLGFLLPQDTPSSFSVWVLNNEPTPLLVRDIVATRRDGPVLDLQSAPGAVLPPFASTQVATVRLAHGRDHELLGPLFVLTNHTTHQTIQVPLMGQVSTGSLSYQLGPGTFHLAHGTLAQDLYITNNHRTRVGLLAVLSGSTRMHVSGVGDGTAWAAPKHNFPTLHLVATVGARSTRHEALVVTTAGTEVVSIPIHPGALEVKVLDGAVLPLIDAQSLLMDDALRVDHERAEADFGLVAAGASPRMLLNATNNAPTPIRLVNATGPSGHVDLSVLGVVARDGRRLADADFPLVQFSKADTPVPASPRKSVGLDMVLPPGCSVVLLVTLRAKDPGAKQALPRLSRISIWSPQTVAGVVPVRWQRTRAGLTVVSRTPKAAPPGHFFTEALYPGTQQIFPVVVQSRLPEEIHVHRVSTTEAWVAAIARDGRLGPADADGAPSSARLFDLQVAPGLMPQKYNYLSDGGFSDHAKLGGMTDPLNGWDKAALRRRWAIWEQVQAKGLHKSTAKVLVDFTGHAMVTLHVHVRMVWPALVHGAALDGDGVPLPATLPPAKAGRNTGSLELAAAASQAALGDLPEGSAPVLGNGTRRWVDFGTVPWGEERAAYVDVVNPTPYPLSFSAVLPETSHQTLFEQKRLLRGVSPLTGALIRARDSGIETADGSGGDGTTSFVLPTTGTLMQVVPPGGAARIGPVWFVPRASGPAEGELYIRNNLTLAERVSLVARTAMPDVAFAAAGEEGDDANDIYSDAIVLGPPAAVTRIGGQKAAASTPADTRAPTPGSLRPCPASVLGKVGAGAEHHQAPEALECTRWRLAVVNRGDGGVLVHRIAALIPQGVADVDVVVEDDAGIRVAGREAPAPADRGEQREIADEFMWSPGFKAPRTFDAEWTVEPGETRTFFVWLVPEAGRDLPHGVMDAGWSASGWRTRTLAQQSLLAQMQLAIDTQLGVMRQGLHVQAKAPGGFAALALGSVGMQGASTAAAVAGCAVAAMCGTALYLWAPTKARSAPHAGAVPRSPSANGRPLQATTSGRRVATSASGRARVSRTQSGKRLGSAAQHHSGGVSPTSRKASACEEPPDAIAEQQDERPTLPAGPPARRAPGGSGLSLPALLPAATGHLRSLLLLVVNALVRELAGLQKRLSGERRSRAEADTALPPPENRASQSSAAERPAASPDAVPHVTTARRRVRKSPARQRQDPGGRTKAAAPGESFGSTVESPAQGSPGAAQSGQPAASDGAATPVGIARNQSVGANLAGEAAAAAAATTEPVAVSATEVASPAGGRVAGRPGKAPSQVEILGNPSGASSGKHSSAGGAQPSSVRATQHHAAVDHDVASELLHKVHSPRGAGVDDAASGVSSLARSATSSARRRVKRVQAIVPTTLAHNKAGTGDKGSAATGSGSQVAGASSGERRKEPKAPPTPPPAPPPAPPPTDRSTGWGSLGSVPASPRTGTAMSENTGTDQGDPDRPRAAGKGAKARRFQPTYSSIDALRPGSISRGLDSRGLESRSPPPPVPPSARRSGGSDGAHEPGRLTPRPVTRATGPVGGSPRTDDARVASGAEPLESQLAAVYDLPREDTQEGAFTGARLATDAWQASGGVLQAEQAPDEQFPFDSAFENIQSDLRFLEQTSSGANAATAGGGGGFADHSEMMDLSASWATTDLPYMLAVAQQEAGFAAAPPSGPDDFYLQHNPQLEQQQAYEAYAQQMRQFNAEGSVSWEAGHTDEAVSYQRLLQEALAQSQANAEAARAREALALSAAMSSGYTSTYDDMVRQPQQMPMGGWLPMGRSMHEAYPGAPDQLGYGSVEDAEAEAAAAAALAAAEVVEEDDS
ncbi:unnamed protein product [Pedinophyceae sp. YPF-701]|nr:unnamed protein product [Pedinophyceae sp. YPF-701]